MKMLVFTKNINIWLAVTVCVLQSVYFYTLLLLLYRESTIFHKIGGDKWHRAFYGTIRNFKVLINSYLVAFKFQLTH